jgi:3-methyladenine DNA glycosylase AlkD
MKKQEILEKVRQELRKNSDPHASASGKKFFKEAVRIYGVKTAIVTKIARSFNKEIKTMEKGQILLFCEKLWQSGYLEESFIACHWSYRLRRQYQPADFAIFEKWVNNYVSNWASCDTFCNHTIGAFIEMYPDYLNSLKKWTKSNNRWVRRASAVSLIVPARRGKFLQDIFEIANLLLLDNDDLVQKGYGWLLKVTSQKYQNEVFAYVMRKKVEMPRTALRYAIEKMPPNLKAKAMAK